MLGMIGKLRDGVGVAAAAVLVVGAALLVDAPAVSAPEPARLNGSLSGQGSTVLARFVRTGTPTTVVQWPGSWAANTTLKPGTPCATYAMAAGNVTTQVIHAYGNYRKCA